MNDTENATKNENNVGQPKYKIGDWVYGIIGTSSRKKEANITFQKITGYGYTVSEGVVKFDGYLFGADDASLAEKYCFDNLDDTIRAANVEIAERAEKAGESNPLADVVKSLVNAMGDGAKVEVSVEKEGSDDE